MQTQSFRCLYLKWSFAAATKISEVLRMTIPESQCEERVLGEHGKCKSIMRTEIADKMLHCTGCVAYQ